jgi:hypothetical protein
MFAWARTHAVFHVICRVHPLNHSTVKRALALDHKRIWIYVFTSLCFPEFI